MRINMSKEEPMGIVYPPRPLAEPRSGRYAGCESAAGVGLPERSEPEGPQGAARERMLLRETKTTVAIYCGNQV